MLWGLLLHLSGYSWQKYVDKSVSDIEVIYKIFQYKIIDHNRYLNSLEHCLCHGININKHNQNYTIKLGKGK